MQRGGTPWQRIALFASIPTGTAAEETRGAAAVFSANAVFSATGEAGVHAGARSWDVGQKTTSFGFRLRLAHMGRR
jgi:hypothetical protein